MSNPAQWMLRADMALTENGTPATPTLRRAGIQRGNTPRNINNLVRGPQPGKKARLWITDRILEPQTIPHFFEFLMCGNLPGGRKTARPLLTADEVFSITKPPSEWAPAPFNEKTRSISEWIGVRIGSYEDSSRLWPIAKELHAMKSRLWEGMPPLSERRWKELELDNPENFPKACRYIAGVIEVFAYLNSPKTKANLRTTFNLIWDHLKEFEDALNAKRRSDSADGVYQKVSVTGLWYQHIRAHYDSIVDNAHRWVIEHIDRLRDQVIQELANHYPTDPNHFDDKQWELTNKFHDLTENAAQADYTIFLPTDGYKGDILSAKEHEPLTTAHSGGFRESPIRWSANLAWRASDYSKRLRYLHRKEQYDNYARHDFRMLDPSVPVNDPASMLITTLSQIDAQTQTRQELRGLPQPPELDHWIEYARRLPSLRLGFVAYRLCHKDSSEIWDDFKAKFEADIADWGRGKTDIDDIRKACKIHWIDGQENEIPDGDIEAARKHFETLELPDIPVHERVFLVVDEATMTSYLKPTKDAEKFFLAVDVNYEATDEKDDESPGYQGTLKILGSLLWDELSAMLVRQGAFLDDLWPMAMSDPESIYRGPKVTPVLKFSSYADALRWELACNIVPRLVAYKQALGSRNG
ncbi:hypothetical protein FSARC_12997 [Fusarium sarcochroum]|uniref:Uncharacterized protein n=1 Tax=Fusarium sarcochroum TaxID=1208366 RepID=A0A8H4T4I4_9HYPO|nr:hypothetical protein FSARC_12997 [Fusarium sarcochroum]